MRKLMPQDVLQFRPRTRNASNRNAKLAVVQSSRPRRRLCNVEEFLLRVEDHDDAIRRFAVELPGQVAVSAFQRIEQLSLQFRRRLVPLVAQQEMRALLLP